MTAPAFLWHGGRLAEARAHFGEGLQPWLDLSTGINPIPWPGAHAIAPDWQSLPDPAALAALEATAARHFGVDPELCCAAPGSEIALRLLGRLIDLPGVHLAPTYRTHAVVCATPARNIGDLAEASLLLLANPNNPDGRTLSPAQVERWLNQQERAGGWLALDEAFADAQPDTSMAPVVADHRPLIVLRSFGKFFGLAGVRLGFLLAPRPIIAAFRRLLGDWPLSGAALAIGTAAYADQAWIDATRHDLAKRASRLDRLLRSHGHDPIGACPHFRLITVSDGGALFAHLAGHAILTRPFAEHPRWLRLGIPAGDEELARLDRALADG